MEDILCNISAFRFHRLPPVVKAAFPEVPSIDEDRRRHLLRNHPLVHELGDLPIHLLATDRAHRTSGELTRHHLITNDIPLGHIQDTDLGIKVVSPELALFQLAQSISELHLLMAMYEVCGTFSVYAPSTQVEKALEGDATQHLSKRHGWRRVYDGKGRATSLWSRPPLIEIEDLRSFAKAMAGNRGCRSFERAANSIAGVVASPFEAQLAILLSYPRGKGGEGLSGFGTNVRIPLAAKARRLAGRNACYADVLFEKTGENEPLIIECQGKAVHDNRDAIISDSDRLTALQQMGYDALLLTYSQIADPKNFTIVRNIIFNKLGLKYRDKSPRQSAAEQELRRNLFIDWETLGQ